MERPDFLRQPSEKAGTRHPFSVRFGSVLRSPLVAAVVVGGALFVGGGLVFAGGVIGQSVSAWIDQQIESHARADYESTLAAETAAAQGQAQAALMQTQAEAIRATIEIDRQAANAQISDTTQSLWTSRFAANLGDIGCALEHVAADTNRDLCNGVTSLRQHMAEQYPAALEAGRSRLAERALEGIPAPHEVIEPELEAARSRYAPKTDESE